MSSVSDEQAIITIEVDLVSKVTGDPTALQERPDFFGQKEEEEKPEEGPEVEVDDISKIIEDVVKQDLDEAVEDVMIAEGVDLDSLEELTKLMKGVDSSGISNIKALASNPQGFMQNTIMSVLSRAGPYGALAAAIIAAIAATPAMVSAVVEALGVKGGPLNQDYAFTEEEQYGQAFSRQVQYRRVTGDDPIITVTTKGFVAGDADFNDNSLVDVETGRMGRVDLNQNSLGLIYGP